MIDQDGQCRQPSRILVNLLSNEQLTVTPSPRGADHAGIFSLSDYFRWNADRDTESSLPVWLPYFFGDCKLRGSQQKLKQLDIFELRSL